MAAAAATDIAAWATWPIRPGTGVHLTEWTDAHTDMVRRAAAAGHLPLVPCRGNLPNCRDYIRQALLQAAELAARPIARYVSTPGRDLLVIDPLLSWTGASPSEYATAGARCAASVHGRRSAAQKWKEQPELWFKDVVQWRGGVLTTDALMLSTRYVTALPALFPVPVAVAALQWAGATSVFDPSAGWGDRLSAALAVPAVRRYTGVDPNPALATGHGLIARCAAHVGKSPEDFTVLQCGAEAAPRPATPADRVDTVLSSPPFMWYETYEPTAGGASGQAADVFPGDAWWTTFWPAYIETCAAWCAPGGTLLLHCVDSPSKGLVWTARAVDAVSAHPAFTFRQHLVVLRGKGEYPLYVWTRVAEGS